ncbi:MAG: T9SS type A sorting domain-containing protein, partial [bacterium]
ATNVGNEARTVSFRFNNNQFSAEPEHFEVPGGGAVNFTLRFAPQQEGLIQGQMTIAIRGGDLGEIGRVSVSGRGVRGGPQIAIEPEVIELSVWIDLLGNIWEETSATLIVSNPGQQVLNVENIQGIPQWLNVHPLQFQVDPDNQREVSIEVSPQEWEAMEPDVYHTTLVIISNAINNQELEVPLIFDRGFIPYYRILLPEDLPEEIHIIMVAQAILNDEELAQWDEIGIWTPRDELAGSGYLENPDEWPIIAIAWGRTQNFNGFQQGDPFNFTIYDHSVQQEYLAQAEWIEGPDRFENEGLSIITLTGLPPIEEYLIPLRRGWQIISLPLDFSEQYYENEVPVVSRILESITENLILVKDYRGRFYAPRFQFNNIPFWNALEGYSVKMIESDTIEVEGLRLPTQTEINLPDGWSALAYLPSESMSLGTAFADLVAQEILVIVKKGDGRFFIPRWNIGVNTPVYPWEGLLIKLSQNTTFRYPNPQVVITSGRSALQVNSNPICQDFIHQPRHFPTPEPTDNNMSVVIASWDGEDYTIGAELGCITPRNTIGGSLLIESDLPWGMAVWGDDALTEEIEGFRNGESLQFLYWDPETDTEHPVNFEVVEGGEPVYQPNGILILGMTLSVKYSNPFVPTAFSVLGPYPNPFNSDAEFSLTIPSPSPIHIHIRDTGGRIVKEMTLEPTSPGFIHWTLSGKDLSAGVYIVTINYQGTMIARKACLLK